MAERTERFCLVAVSERQPGDQEKNYQINQAMKALYRQGCRRLRTIRLPRTGDWTKYKVMGWAN